jgi:primosomal protein N' (replication factor Y)
LKNLGAGTQKIEEETASLFPQARIARLDSDTAQNKNFEAKTIRDFAKGDIDILIGTQIVTKGFDFCKLKLVAVVSADSLLAIQDFRADEKALQMLEQFRGRCGRREDKGLFVIQTSQPGHPVYQRIANNEAILLNSDLLKERKDFNFPPYTRIVEINIKDNIEDRGKRMSEKLALKLRGQFTQGRTSLLGDPITGPYSPVVDKVADQYIRTIRLSLKKDRNLTYGKETLKKTISAFEKENRYDGHITINVDPS